MGIDPPFLYTRPPSFKFDAQSSQRGFNPRAATDAEWTRAQHLKEKRASELAREGPLIDRNELNKHPDSWMVVNTGYLDFKPLSKHYKRGIVWVRNVQLALRVLSLIGSIGLLVVLIFIKTVGQESDWILRIPPGIAIVHNLYAIWHLAKHAAARTPASSASYFIFASIFDAGLVPFMIYTTLDVHNEWLMVQDGVDGHWTTLFGDANNWPLNTTQAAWLTAATLGCIWIATFCMCVFLAMAFRKISNLPPDMNPLEEHLTSRSNSTHKKTKSTISQVTETESNRDSMTALLNEKGVQVPWIQTRNGSTTSLGSTSPTRSPRHSRYESVDSLTPPRSPYKPSNLGENSARNSTASLASTQRRHGHVRTDSNGEPLLPPSPNRHTNPPSPYRSTPTSPTRSSALQPGISRSRVESPVHSIYHDARASQSSRSVNKHPESTTKEQTWPLSPTPSEGNWLASGSSDSDFDQSLVPEPLGSTPPEFRHLRRGSPNSKKRPTEHSYVMRTASKYDYTTRSPKPLGMNPPTPPVDPAAAAQAAENAQINAERAGNGHGTYRSSRANRASRNRQALQATEDAGNRGSMTQWSAKAEGDANWVEHFQEDFADGAAETKPMLQSKWTAVGAKRASRVVSSGYEQQEVSLRQGAVRERQVSGKVVEEGRGSMQALRAEMGWV